MKQETFQYPSILTLPAANQNEILMMISDDLSAFREWDEEDDFALMELRTLAAND